MMPVSTNKNKKKMQWSSVIRRPAFILPKRELSAPVQDTDASQTEEGASKVKNTPTIRSKTKVSSSAVAGIKSVDTSSTKAIPHSVVVIIIKTESERETTTTTKEGYIATEDHASASAVRPMVVSAPSILHTGVHPPFVGVQSTFGSEHAVSQGKERRPPSDSTISENDGISLGGSFRLANALQERTNLVLDRKVPATRKHVRCEGDVLPFSEKSVTANDNAKTKARVKSDTIVAVKDRPQDQPGSYPSSPFPTLYSYGKKVTMIDPNLMIFVIDMVPADICNAILDCTSRHVRCMTAIGNADKCWRSLYTYTKMDIPCAEVPGLGNIMQRIMLGVVGIIGEM
jgi:hypothetical protein